MSHITLKTFAACVSFALLIGVGFANAADRGSINGQPASQHKKLTGKVDSHYKAYGAANQKLNNAASQPSSPGQGFPGVVVAPPGF